MEAASSGRATMIRGSVTGCTAGTFGGGLTVKKSVLKLMSKLMAMIMLDVMDALGSVAIRCTVRAC